MTGEALQIDFRPQPKGIAVVTSAPISMIAESGNFATFQDLIDGYAASFASVHVFSPNGDPVVKPIREHRVNWHSGPNWLSPMNGLWWTVFANRSEFENIELVRTFGPRAGIVGKALSKFSKSPHVSSSDDLSGNTWRDITGWRSVPTKVVSKLGMLRANVLSATLDWEVEYLSETGYTKDLLLGNTGLATDIYTPVGTTDPTRHPVVLWAGPSSSEESIRLIEESALSTQQMIENVEFVVIGDKDNSAQLRENIAARELPVTIVGINEVEPLVDLIERTWACVTSPARGFPSGLAMFAASAGVPIISLGELEENFGFKNHLNHMSIDPESHEAVAYSLQLLRRWTDWSLRIGLAGQRLVEERYSTKTVAVKEGKQLARIARFEDMESSEPAPLKLLKPYVSPSAGEIPSLIGEAVVEAVEEELEDYYASAGFDLVAAALADITGTKPAAEPAEPAADMGQDVISAMFAANDAAAEPMGEPAAEMDQDAISALFASNDSAPEPTASAEPVEGSGDMDQDAISALFASNDPAPEPTASAEPVEASGDMDQDAISALFASNDPAPEPVADVEPVDASGDMGQDAINALLAASDVTSEPEPTNEPEIDPEPQERDFVEAIIEARKNPAEPIEFSLDDLDNDLPDVNLIQFGSGTSEDEADIPIDFDEEEVDMGLITSILEGRDVDPYA